MERTLHVLNRLERKGVLGRYAIGGAMAATFYAEPVLTFDLDIFIALPETAGGLLSLAPLYSALRQEGYAEENECVIIEGVPVQFLPVHGALLEEALKEARDTFYETTPTRVLRAEHLVAIALQTGRDKDLPARSRTTRRPKGYGPQGGFASAKAGHERVRLLREEATLDRDYLAEVLARHGLDARWKQWTP